MLDRLVTNGQAELLSENPKLYRPQQLADQAGDAQHPPTEDPTDEAGQTDAEENA